MNQGSQDQLLDKYRNLERIAAEAVGLVREADALLDDPRAGPAANELENRMKVFFAALARIRAAGWKEGA